MSQNENEYLVTSQKVYLNSLKCYKKIYQASQQTFQKSLSNKLQEMLKHSLDIKKYLSIEELIMTYDTSLIKEDIIKALYKQFDADLEFLLELQNEIIKNVDSITEDKNSI